MSGKTVSMILQKNIPEGKLVAIAIASHCFRKSLSCWPSVALLAQECQITKRQIFNVLSQLKSVGYLSIKRRSRQTAILTLHPDKMSDLRGELHFTSETLQGEIHNTPEVKSTSLRGEIHFTRNKEEPVRTGKSNVNHKPVAPLLFDVQSLPEWLPLDSWEGFLEMRKKIRAPMTDRATYLILKKLGELRKQGHDPAALLDEATERGWRTVFPPKKPNGGAYVNKAEQRQHDNLRARDEARAAIVAGR
jgi:hypothetical protein